MKQTYKRFFVLAVLTVGLAGPALAILGLGDIVFDPTSYGELIQQFYEMQQQYQQLVQTYQTIQSQYQEMLFMAQQDPVNMLTRYRALATPWLNSSATNVYGTSGGWIAGINSGLGVASGYSRATQSLGTYGPALANIPTAQLPRIQTSYATVELTDGANLAAMQTLGKMRANAPAIEATIQNLETDSLSSNPNMNTEIAVLNKINAANVIALRNTQDANKLLATLAEEKIIDAKRQRDAEAQAFNDHIQFMAQGQAAMSSQAAGASQAMLNWRMP
jgi:type IV secretion system protein TrbJ